MKKILLYPIGTTGACQYAVDFLKDAGCNIVDHPTPEVTHLLLDVPSFGVHGQLRSGDTLSGVLDMLPQYITVIGGNLDHPLLEEHPKMDLLQNSRYLAMNAQITAHCALTVAAPLLRTYWPESPALIIGWGRIGKCLGQLLKAMGCDVTIAARNLSDLAMMEAMGYKALEIHRISSLGPYRLLFNTAPETVLSDSVLHSNPDCVKIDLASRKGLDCPDCVWARGLPGIHAPESSGRLIADTILSWIQEVVQ